MALVDLEVNGRFYQLHCEDGQEQRLRDLAAYVDGKLRQVTGGGKSGTDAHMLLVTALVMADEMQELLTGRGLPAPKALPSADEAEAVAAIDGIARRIEEVAARLERA